MAPISRNARCQIAGGLAGVVQGGGAMLAGKVMKGGGPVAVLGVAGTVVATAQAANGLATMGIGAHNMMEGGRRLAAEDASSGTKEVTVSKGDHPESAKHIEDAQNAGQPTELTIDRDGAAARRRAALKEAEPIPEKDRDEYPPAMVRRDAKEIRSRERAARTLTTTTAPIHRSRS